MAERLAGIKSAITDKIVNTLGIQTAVDKVPNELLSTIQPVLSVEPEVEIKFIDGDCSDNTSTTIMTTSSTKKTYLVGACLSVAKDNISTSKFSHLTSYPKGKGSSSFLKIRYEPTTAGQFTQTIVFPEPVLLEKDTPIAIINQAAVASIDATGIIYYYEVED